MLPTIILRHRKENLKKCSLTGLEKRKDLLFFTYPLKKELPDLSSYAILSIDGQELTDKNRPKGIILIDGTWRYAEKMQASIMKYNLPLLSLPERFTTAYPRKQTGCSNVKKGLSSVEALFLTYLLLGKDTVSLLDSYYWKKEFLLKNFPQGF